MAEHEKQLAENLAKTIAGLPSDKKQYFLGFAEGVAAMAEQPSEEGRKMPPLGETGAAGCTN